ncbi:MAG: DUF2490 domain-containing protein [Bacteroidota bacterium]|nr:DUF2490 domain-containing protein [Bacteroidota bacterium]
MIKAKKISFILLFVLTSTVGLGQELWIGPKVKLDLNEQFEIKLKQECRFDENASSLKKSLIQVGVEWKPYEFASMEIGYRKCFFPEKKVANIIIDEDEKRIFLSLSLDKKIVKDVTIKYRTKYQRDDKKEGTDSEKEHILRNRLTIDYNLSSIADPYLSGEIYYRFDDKNEFRRYRIIMGLETKIIKRLDLDTFLLLQRDYNIKTPETTWIMGVSLKYSIKL